MAKKSKQSGVRLEEPQALRLDLLAKQFSNTPSGLVRLAVDRLIFEFDKTGELPKNPLVDNAQVSASAGKGGAL